MSVVFHNRVLNENHGKVVKTFRTEHETSKSPKGGFLVERKMHPVKSAFVLFCRHSTE